MLSNNKFSAADAKLLSSATDSWVKSSAQAAKQRQKDDEWNNIVNGGSKTVQQGSSDQQKKDDEPWWKKALDFASDTGKNIAAGAQQGAAKVADVALEGGNVLSSLGDMARGDNAALVKDSQTTQAIRDKLHNLKDVNGTNLGGVQGSDKAVQNIQSGKGSANDVAKIAGDSLDVGLGATQFVNPTGLLKGAAEGTAKTLAKDAVETAAKSTLKNAIKQSGKDAALYGGLGGVQSGLDTYGDTGDIKKSLEASGKGAIEGGLAQGVLDLAGHGVGAAIGRLKNGKPDVNAKPADVTKATPADTNANKVDITDPDIPTQLKQRAIANGNDYVPDGKNIVDAGEPPVVPAEPKQLPATTEKSADIQAAIDDLTKGNYGDHLYDYKTSDGQSFTANDVAAATNKQIRTLTNRQDDLIRRRDIATKTDDMIMQKQNQDGIDAIQRQIDELNKSGVTPTGEPATSKELNTKAVANEFKNLQDRLVVAKNQEAANQQFKDENTFNGTGRDIDQTVRAVNDLNSGKVPDEVKVDSEPYKSTNEVVADMPQLKETVDNLNREKYQTVDQLSKIMTPDSAERAKANLSRQYEMEMSKYADSDPIRQKYEGQKLQDAYLKKLQEIDDSTVKDSSNAKELSQHLRDLQDQDSEILRKANYVKGEFPDRFKVVDDDKMDQYRANISKDLVLHMDTPSEQTVNNVITNAVNQSSSPEALKSKMQNDSAYAKALNHTVQDAMNAEPSTGSPGMSLLAAPTDVMRHYEKAGNAIADVLEDSQMKFSVATAKTEMHVEDWNKIAVDNKYDTNKIAASLDGEKVKLNEGENSLREEVSQYFDEMAEKIGLPKGLRISEYYPHIFKQQYGKDYNAVEKIFAQLKYGKDEAGNVIDAAHKQKLARQITNIDPNTAKYIEDNLRYSMKSGHLMKRTGAEGYERNLFGDILHYDSSVNKQLYYDPAFKTARSLSENMSAGFQSYLNKTIDSIKGRHDTAFEQSMDKLLGEGNTAKFMSGVNRLSNNSLMGLSVRTGIIQLQDTSRVVADRKLSQIVKSLPFALQALKHGTAANREYLASGVGESSYSSFMQNLRNEIGNKSKFAKGMSKFERGTIIMASKMDDLNRALNYKASMEEYLAKHPGDAEGALKYTHSTNRKTVGSFSGIDRSAALNTPVGKILTNIQGFNIFNARYIMHLVGGDERSLFVNKDGSRLTHPLASMKSGQVKLSADGAARLTKYVIGNALFYGTVGQALGLSVADILPFGNELQEGQLPESPVASALLGNDYQKGIIPTAGATISQAIKAASGKQNDLGGALEDSASALGGAAKGLIPLQTQTNRTITGVNSVNEGYARNSKGDIQFKQDSDPMNTLMATLFGKNATTAGKNFKASGGQALSDKQMRIGTKESSGVNIDKLPDDVKKQYVDMYSTINKANPYNYDTKKDLKTETLDKAEELVRSGQYNAAMRYMKDYNEKVSEPMREFISRNGSSNITPAMKKQMTSLLLDEDSLKRRVLK